MWKKVQDFWAHFKPTVLWATGYVFVAYGLFRWLFRFNIFQEQSWTGLSSAYLRGLWGLAFCILLVAIPTIFIASTITVWNTKKVLISFKPDKKKDAPKEIGTPKAEEQKEEAPLPADLPEELRAPYLKMRSGGLAKAGVTAISVPTVETPDVPATNADMERGTGSLMPLPDFSFDAAPKTNAPVFKEIVFGHSLPPVQESDESDKNLHIGALKTHLASLGYATRDDDAIIIAHRADAGGPALAVATHGDPDFWIADGDAWFATGKQKQSPVVALKAAADKHAAIPILYLAEKNIMNLDTLSKTWAASGIRMISAPTEI
jgi:hypothetical protein